eukprot:s60_g45.t1
MRLRCQETAVVFPFFMASLAIIRKAMRWIFTEEELKQLDGHPAEDPDEVEEPEATKPDLLNLEPTKAGVLASRPLLTQISTQAGLDGSFRN